MVDDDDGGPVTLRYPQHCWPRGAKATGSDLSAFAVCQTGIESASKSSAIENGLRYFNNKEYEGEEQPE
jgi:hypothetical protein